MSEYLEMAGIIFVEIVLVAVLFKAVYETLKYIWEILK